MVVELFTPRGLQIRDTAGCKSALRGGSARHAPRRQLGCRENLNYFWFRLIWRRGALSSVVEHFIHTEGVAGSNPAARTIRRTANRIAGSLFSKILFPEERAGVRSSVEPFEIRIPNAAGATGRAEIR